MSCSSFRIRGLGGARCPYGAAAEEFINPKCAKLPKDISNGRHPYQQFSLFVYRRYKRRQVAFGRAFGDLTVGGESRAVAWTKKGTIRFDAHEATPMCANRRQGKEFVLPANDEKAQGPETAIDAVGGIIVRRAGVDDP